MPNRKNGTPRATPERTPRQHSADGTTHVAHATQRNDSSTSLARIDEGNLQLVAAPRPPVFGRIDVAPQRHPPDEGRRTHLPPHPPTHLPRFAQTNVLKALFEV